MTKCVSKRNDSSSMSFESMPKQLSTRSTQQEGRISSGLTYEVVPFNPTSSSSKWRFSWKGLTSFSYLKSWSMISEAFGWQEHEMEIGYPTDVKHLAHIGWDGSSVGSSSWIDELKPSPDFATGPLKEIGQPVGSEWIHDALSAAKLTTPGFGDQSGPRSSPPTEFSDPGMASSHTKRSKWRLSWLRRKSRAPSENPRAC